MITAGFSVPFRKIYSRYRLEEQRQKAYQELREILYVLSSGFASGAGLRDSMRDCGGTLQRSYGERSYLVGELEYMLHAMDEGNVSEVELLRNFSRKTGFPELNQLVSIYSLCLRTGGDLPKAMIETSDSILRRLQMYQELQAKTSQKRLEFTIMSLMIPILLLSVNGTSDYLEPLYHSPEGRILMTLGLLGSLTAFGWSTKILEGGRV